MPFAIRLAIWFLGVAFMFLPLAVAIAPRASQVTDVLSLASYREHYRELLFIGVAAGAVAIAEASELAWASLPRHDSRKIISVMLLLVMIIAVVACASWYGAANEQIRHRVGACMSACTDAGFVPDGMFSHRDVAWVMGLNAAILFTALLLRVTLWSAAKSSDHA